MFTSANVQGLGLWTLLDARKTLYTFDRRHGIFIFNVNEAWAILGT
jgi:hypothetical protein